LKRKLDGKREINYTIPGNVIVHAGRAVKVVDGQAEKGIRFQKKFVLRFGHLVTEAFTVRQIHWSSQRKHGVLAKMWLPPSTIRRAKNAQLTHKRLSKQANEKTEG
jgi:hypothetical protein